MEKEDIQEKIIELPCYGIVISLTGDGSGSITSDIKESCSYCQEFDCNMDCHEFQKHCFCKEWDKLQEKQSERIEFLCHRAAADALESIILGHAVAEVDVSTPAYLEGIETAIQGLTNVDYSEL